MPLVTLHRLVAAIVIMLSMAASAAAEDRRFTLDDMMKVEGLGAAVSDPQERWFVYERVRPYDTITDYSFRTYAFWRSGHQLWRYDVAGGGLPERLPGIDPEPHTYLQGFSPDGAFLSFMQYHFGKLSLGAYDMTAEETKLAKRTPALNRSGDHNPIWISDEEIVFSAVPEHTLPSETSARAHTGDLLSAAWRAAWRGDQVTASEVRTRPVDESDSQEDGDLIRFNARTGEEEILAAGLFVDLRASPDRKRIAALSASKPRGFDRVNAAEFDPRKYRLVIFSPETGESSKVAEHLEIFPYTLAWSSDSKRVAFYAWPEDSDPRFGRFHVADIASGETTAYDHIGLDLASERERGFLQRPERVVFLGDQLAVFARKTPEEDDPTPRFTPQTIRPEGAVPAAWYALTANGEARQLTHGLTGVAAIPIHSAAGHFTITADDGAYRVYADGRRTRLTPPLDGRFHYMPPGTFSTRSGVLRPEFSEHALFTVTDGADVRIVVLNLGDVGAGASVIEIPPGRGVQTLAAMPASGATLFRSEDGLVSRVLLSNGPEAGQFREIDRLNTHLSGLEYGSWRRVAYEVDVPEADSSPRALETCVLLPPGYQVGDRLALIVDVYPDRRSRCDNDGPRISYPDPHSPYLWASKGYAYARVSTPRSLIRTEDGPIADIDDAIIAGVDALVREGLVDPERVALHGFSQGAISALYVAARSDRFKAVIAKNGWTNMFSHYFGGAGVYAYFFEAFGEFLRYESIEGSDFGIGTTPFENPEIFIRNSPVFLAPQINAPVLLIHSDMDSFAMTQFDEMFSALLRAGKDARYVRYWGEGHGPSSPANLRDMTDRIDEFLTEHGVTP